MLVIVLLFLMRELAFIHFTLFSSISGMLLHWTRAHADRCYSPH